MKKILIIFLFIGSFSSLFAQEKNALQMRADPEVFSPDGNGIQDQTFFYPVINTNEVFTHWELVISNDKGKKCNKLSGVGMVAMIPWDGTDKSKEPLPEGRYAAVFEGWGKSSHLKSEPVTVIVDRSPPMVNVQVSTPILDQARDGRAEISFFPTVLELSGLDRWQFQILDVAGRTVFVDWSTGPLRACLWNAKDDRTGVLVPEGKYICVFIAWDRAGNESIPAAVYFEIKITPAEILRNLLKKIVVYETPSGLITQLKMSDLFINQKSDIGLSSNGEDLLKETSFLLNAYPNIPVRLDGYCHRFSSGEKNRDLSSLYGWRVYSYLVKKGNVKPSRISVRGRGQTPPPERVSEPQPLRDGVEIILEGHQNW